MEVESTSEERFRRGSGVKHTIPFIGRFAGLWFLVTTIAVLVASVSTYVIFVDRGMGTDGRFVAMLVFQTVFILLALGGLAVFSTHRLAGPWIAVHRALADVRGGDLHRVLRIRRADEHLRLVEDEFNGMMENLRERLGEPGP
jgi:HAMP domain-containing protein